MFFDNYHLHKEARIRETLLWDYDIDKINWHLMRNIIVQRVIERGRIDDFYAILNLYGLGGVKSAIKNIAWLNSKDQVFVSSVFEIKKEELKCYSSKQLKNQHWSS